MLRKDPSEDMSSLVHIGDRSRLGGQVDLNRLRQAEREVGIGDKVGVPISGAGWTPRDIDLPGSEIMEPNLLTSWETGSSSFGSDVYHQVGG